MLLSWTKQYKTCKFSGKSSFFPSYIQHKKNQWIHLAYVSLMLGCFKRRDGTFFNLTWVLPIHFLLFFIFILYVGPFSWPWESLKLLWTVVFFLFWMWVVWGSALCSTMSMFDCVFTPVCLCSTIDRKVVCFIVSLVHHVSFSLFVPPQGSSMFHCVFTPPCLCPTIDRRVACSIVFLVHRVYGSLCLCSTTEGFYSPLCLCSITGGSYTPLCL